MSQGSLPAPFCPNLARGVQVSALTWSTIQCTGKYRFTSSPSDLFTSKHIIPMYGNSKMTWLQSPWLYLPSFTIVIPLSVLAHYHMLTYLTLRERSLSLLIIPVKCFNPTFHFPNNPNLFPQHLFLPIDKSVLDQGEFSSP